MRRSHLPLWFALIGGLLGLQCLQSISDDCTKTLTCGNEPNATLGTGCLWYYPDGGIWPGGPQPSPVDGKWRWPDGKESMTQFECPQVDAGVGPGNVGDAGLDPTQATCTPAPAFGCDNPLVCNRATNRCVECLSATDCTGTAATADAGPAVACDLKTNRCVACLVEADCAGGSATAHCKVNANDSERNACVQCLGDEQCIAGQEVCNLTNNECTRQCDGRGVDCTEADKPVCNVNAGVCVQCTGDGQCAGTPGASQCNTTTNQCVECTNSVPCSAANQTCDLISNRCVDCLSNDECGGATGLCNTDAHDCVECLDDTQCTDVTKSRCNRATHTCVACNGDGQCESAAPLCRDADHKCVQCRADMDCGEGLHCDMAAGACVACLNDAQCLSATAARCNTATHTCAPCTNEGQCLSKPALGDLCRTTDGVCVDCTEPADCLLNPAASRCAATATTGVCASCNSNTDCALVDTKHACVGTNPGNRHCVECTASTDCTADVNRPACKTTGTPANTVNTCVQCVNNSDCKDPAASRCVENQCAPCSGDADCTGIVSGGTALEACDLAGGPANARCVECTATNRQACTGGANVCNGLSDTNQFRTCTETPTGLTADCQPCVSDAQCQPSHLCVEQRFGGQSTGHFCFPRDTGSGCAARPFVASLSQSVSVDSTTLSTVCGLLLTTCKAYNDLFAALSCTVPENCGVPGLADGLCIPSPDGMTCSIPCAGSQFNCPGNACQTVDPFACSFL